MTVFVGGPEAGKLREVHGSKCVFVVKPKDFAEQDFRIEDCEKITYERMEIVPGLEVFALAGMTVEDVLKEVLTAYVSNAELAEALQGDRGKP